jgi:hypothetical protein
VLQGLLQVMLIEYYAYSFSQLGFKPAYARKRKNIFFIIIFKMLAGNRARMDSCLLGLHLTEFE